MPLQMALTAGQSGIGVAVPASFIRISQYTHDLIKENKVYWNVDYYYDETAKRDRPIKGQSFQCLESQLSGIGKMKGQLEDYMLTLPEFATAIKV